MTPSLLVTAPSVTASRWAVVSLAATVVSGLWLRAAMTWPWVSGGADLQHVVHAHSHVAFFGWLVLAIASLAARRVDWTPFAAARWRRVVHALGVLSLVALVAFARAGYDVFTIALSAAHVALWIPLARLAWPMQRATLAERAWWRAAWIALLAAGAVTVVPGIFAARGVRDGWWREFGIKLFLTLFINGFAGFATMGLLLARDARARASADAVAWARRTMAVALGPLAILYVVAPAPMPWMTWLARVAVGTMAIATAIVVFHASRRPHALWVRMAIAAWALIAFLQAAAALGIGANLIHGRPVTVAFTHLVLLLAVSPVLAAAIIDHPALRWRPLVATMGAGVMCASLATLGWPWMATLATDLGAGAMRLLFVVAIGSAVAGGAWLSLFPLLLRARAPEDA